MIWFTPEEAATVAHCHPETVRVALRNGDLKGTQAKVHGRWLVREDRLDSWIEGGTQGKSAKKVAA